MLQLRIIFCRFYAIIAEGPNNHDPTIIDAISTNAPGLRMIHGKRLWKDFQKLFAGKNAEHSFKKMVELGFSPHIGERMLVQIQGIFQKYEHGTENCIVSRFGRSEGFGHEVVRIPLPYREKIQLPSHYLYRFIVVDQRTSNVYLAICKSIAKGR